MTTIPPAPFPRKGVTFVRRFAAPGCWLCRPWDGPADGIHDHWFCSAARMLRSVPLMKVRLAS